METKNAKSKINANFTVIVTQVVFCVLILIIIIAVKLFGGDLNDSFTRWYNDNIRDKTDINEVLDDSTLNSGNNKLLVLSHSVAQDDSYFINPLNTSGVITSVFGYRQDPINGEYKMHNGLDIAADKGSGILSVYDGTVLKTGYEDGYGNFIILQHTNGLKTLYGHCDTIIAKTGDKIKQGDVIATVGSTGRSTGNHLHFEIIKDGSKVDPLWIIG